MEQSGIFQMAELSFFENAVRRLNAAIDGLGVAVSRHAVGAKAIGDLKQEVQTISDDRSRLAQELDRVNQRVVKLEQVSEEVDRRLEVAIEALEDAIEEAEG